MSENNNAYMYTKQCLSSHQRSQANLVNHKARIGMTIGIICAGCGFQLLFLEFLFLLIPNSCWTFLAIDGALIILSVIALIKCIRANLKGATSLTAAIGIIISIAAVIINGITFLSEFYVMLETIKKYY